MALLEHLGLTRVIDSAEYVYYVGGRTGVGLRPAAAEFAETTFAQGRPGLHHVCFRARERSDVDSVHALMRQLGATVVHPPQEDRWVAGYYSVLFEDPDGIRLEINHVPGKGVFDRAIQQVRTGPSGKE